MDEFKFQSILAEDLLEFYLEYFPDLKAQHVDAIPGEQRAAHSSSTPARMGVGSPGGWLWGRPQAARDVSPLLASSSPVFPYSPLLVFLTPGPHGPWPSAAQARLTELGARNSLGRPPKQGRC